MCCFVFSIAVVGFSSLLIPHSKVFLDSSLLLPPILLLVYSSVLFWMFFSPLTFFSRGSLKEESQWQECHCWFCFLLSSHR